MIEFGDGKLFGDGITLGDLKEVEIKVGKILSELQGNQETIDLLKSIIPPTDHAFMCFPPLGGVALTVNEIIPKNFLIPLDQYGHLMTPIYKLEVSEKDSASEGC